MVKSYFGRLYHRSKHAKKVLDGTSGSLSHAKRSKSSESGTPSVAHKPKRVKPFEGKLSRFLNNSKIFLTVGVSKIAFDPQNEPLAHLLEKHIALDGKSEVNSLTYESDTPLKDSQEDEQKRHQMTFKKHVGMKKAKKQIPSFQQEKGKINVFFVILSLV